MPKFKPTPAGVLVTGIKGDYEAPRHQCRDHIFITLPAVKNDKWHSSYVQGAYCIVCDEEITPMDAAWWKELATPDFIKEVCGYLTEQCWRFDFLLKWLEGCDGVRVRKSEYNQLRRR